MMQRQRRRRHLVFIPLPTIGHIQPMVEFAKHLHRHDHGFSCTFLIVPPIIPSQELSSFLSAAAASFSFVHLPALPPPTLPPSSRVMSLINATLRLYAPLLESFLRTLHSSSPVAAAVLDFFCPGMIESCLGIGVSPYVFCSASASMLALVLHVPALDPLIPTTRDAVDEEASFPVPFPGFSSRPPLAALPDVLANGKDEVYEFFHSTGPLYCKAKGILVNTFLALQRNVLRALEDGLYALRGTPVYPLGPLLNIGVERQGQKHGCLRWLDEQPPGSVVFLCFGSKGRFPRAQTEEIAAGLERSGHRFLWVASDGVPEGFEGRTREMGMVWPSFAPQREILGHAAVGGFVTHCGWNSCLEALWFGVAMAAWPLYAEQHWNAFEMVREMGMAVEVKVERRRGNWASAEEVERAVRELMGEGGEGVRRKVREMREEARRALEEGGSSLMSLEKVLQDWTLEDRVDR